MGPNTGGLVLMTPKLTHAQAVADMKPITDFASSTGNIALNNEVTENPDFYSVRPLRWGFQPSAG